MTNQELKAYAKKKKVFHYQIAEVLEIQESAFSKLFRKEIDAELKCKIKAIIDELYYQNHPEERPKKTKADKKGVVVENPMFDDLLEGL